MGARIFSASGCDDAGGGISGRVSPSDAASLHVQIADIIREKIYAKSWAVRQKIPSEHELMAQYGVSRGTVRRALKSLVDEGLLTQQHGRGTFVAEPGISHPAGVRPLSFAESLRWQGKSFVTHVHDRRIVGAPADVADALEIESGEIVMFMRRIRSVEGEPIMCQESWSNLAECPGLDRIDYTRESLFNAVETCSGRRIKYSNMRYTSRIAGKEHAAYLGCDEAAAVLALEQIIRLQDGAAIEWSITWLKPGQSIVGTAIQPD